MWKYMPPSLAVIALTMGAVSPALAQTPPTAAQQQEKEVSIPFANHGGIDDWRAIDNETLLIKGLGRQWYKAKLFSPCLDLRFVDRIGFLVEPDGSISRWSGIIVRDQVCRFKSLTKTTPPEPKKKK